MPSPLQLDPGTRAILDQFAARLSVGIHDPWVTADGIVIAHVVSPQHLEKIADDGQVPVIAHDGKYVVVRTIEGGALCRFETEALS